MRVELRERLRRKRRQGAAEVDQAVDREHADAAAVGEDREAVARKGLLPPERLGGREKLVEVEDAQEPGAAKGGLIDGIRAGERAGMRGRGARALGVPAGLDDDHRLRPRRGARRRHELPRVVDRLDIEQDGARAAVGGEVVEAVAEIDVDLVAERDESREADLAPRRPFDHPRRDRARLRDQREVAGRGIAAAKLALSFAGGAMTPRQFGPTRRSPCLRARASPPRRASLPVAEAGGDDDGGARRPFAPALATMTGTVAGGVGDDDEIRCLRQSSNRATQAGRLSPGSSG